MSKEEPEIDQVMESTTEEQPITAAVEENKEGEVAMEESTTTTTEYPPSVHKVHRQLVAIFDAENLKKDNFFRELVERDLEGWVAIKKMSMIKRFKEILEGDLSLFEKAASLAPTEFEMNADKTQLRCIKKEVEEIQKEHVEKQTNAIMTHIELQNKRSIYAKGFPIENHASEDELREFYCQYGRVVSLRLRRDGQKNRDGAFKGSIFVEFESPAIAQKVVTEATEYKDDIKLLNMIKYDYVEMKKNEKYQGLDYEISKFNHRHLVEYSNGQAHRYKEIKELVKKVHPNMGRLEPLKTEGTGVIELFKTTPEEFLAKLENQKIQDVNFFLVSSAARSHFNKIQKEAQNQAAKHGGGGRGVRGGRGGRGRRGGHHGGERRKRDNNDSKDANKTEISNKRARPNNGGPAVVEVKSSSAVPVIATAKKD